MKFLLCLSASLWQKMCGRRNFCVCVGENWSISIGDLDRDRTVAHLVRAAAYHKFRVELAATLNALPVKSKKKYKMNDSSGNGNLQCVHCVRAIHDSSDACLRPQTASTKILRPRLSWDVQKSLRIQRLFRLNCINFIMRLGVMLSCSMLNVQNEIGQPLSSSSSSSSCISPSSTK